jgi:hypothetical protein
MVGVGYAVRTAVNGGSKLLIFVLRGAQSRDFRASLQPSGGRLYRSIVLIEQWLGPPKSA